MPQRVWQVLPWMTESNTEMHYFEGDYYEGKALYFPENAVVIFFFFCLSLVLIFLSLKK